MFIDRLRVKDNLEEILGHSSKPFPHTSYYVEPEKFPGGYSPWHWHRDVEVMYIVQGRLKLTTNMGEYVLEAGEAVFLNSNVLHLQTPEKGDKVITLNQVFDASLISGQYRSVFEQKYVEPLLSCREIDAMVFRPSDVRQRKIIDFIRRSQDTADEQAYGYELLVRNELSVVWLLICQEAEEKLEQKKAVKNTGEERLKDMMLYIQEHYMDKLLLKDIAYAANISEREALRSFKKHLNTTPFTYLSEYRIRMATVKLKETEASISDIAYDCGFSSASYFGKIFRETMGCTALEYRRGII